MVDTLRVVFSQFNWIDLIIIIILLFYALEGYSSGFVSAALDFASFIASFTIGLKSYTYIALLLAHFISIPPSFAKAIGFFAISLIAEIVLNIVFGVAKRILFSEKNLGPSSVKTFDKILGIIPGVFSALVLLAFFVTLIVVLPLSPFLKNSLSSSKLGNLIAAKTQGFEKNLNEVFGGAVNETINFLTVEPKSNQIIRFNFKTSKFLIDLSSEEKMLEMVNQERASRGFKPLVFDNKLRDVGRTHCEDMFEKGYFSHYTPEGLSPFDRMGQVDIFYVYAGENLAFSQNVTLAMNGFMQSPGHKANILSPNFGKVGIGVIDGGIYGEMFCQEFMD